MIIERRDPSNCAPRHPSTVWFQHAKNAQPANSKLNTLDQVLAFTHTYAAEIRQDAKAKRIYRSFVALTNNQFEALLAFSLWKVRNLQLAL